MKKVSLALILMPMFLVLACSKDLIEKRSEKMTVTDLKLARMLDGFKTRGESHLKSGSEMSIDSALWYITAAANYTYGDVSHETEKIFTDSIFISIPVNNGKVSEEVVYNKYISLADSLRIIYQSVNHENKQLLSIGIKTHSLTGNELVCKIAATFSYGIPMAPACSFGNNDSYCFWYYWQNRAICEGNTNSTELTDAAEEMQKLIMRCRAVPGGNYWTENETYVPVDPLDYPIDNTIPPNNHRYAHLYWNSSEYPDFNGCIPPEDLNFYLDKTRDLINTETTQGGLRLPGYSFLSIDMWGKIETDISTVYKHEADVKYGIIHMNPNPPVSLE